MVGLGNNRKNNFVKGQEVDETRGEEDCAIKERGRKLEYMGWPSYVTP